MAKGRSWAYIQGMETKETYDDAAMEARILRRLRLNEVACALERYAWAWQRILQAEPLLSEKDLGPFTFVFGNDGRFIRVSFPNPNDSGI